MRKTNIKAIPRSQLDTSAYQACVEASTGCRIYGYSWYLDAVCDDWYALVANDYAAVMPLPIRSKWGIRYVYHPLMIQQLGIYGKRVDEMEFQSIEKQMQHQALMRHLHLDYVYQGDSKIDGSQQKTNQVLRLSRSIDDIRDNMSSNRKRDLKKATTADLKISQITDWTEISSLIAQSTVDNQLPDLKKVEQLYKAGQSTNAIKAIVVKQDDGVLFLLLYGDDGNRIYYLLPTPLQSASHETGAATFAIYALIEKYIESRQFFDFEGSMLPGVQKFYSSFGAKIEPYFYVRKTLIHFLRHAR